MFNFHKKEKPLRSLTGFGGGVGRAFSGAGGGGLVSASGGNLQDGVEPGNGYKYHTFTASGALTVTVGGEVDVLIVAGGGGAAGGYNSGAGGGGVVHHSQFTVSAGPYPVVVGGGGAGSNNPGVDSTFGGMTAKGGGGGCAFSVGAGQPGGSGGGAEGTETNPSGNATQPAQNTPFVPQTGFNQYGNPGGAGTTSGAYSAAGGGGGSAAGQAAGPGPGSGGHGGSGQPVTGFEYPIVGLSPLTPQANSPTNNHYGAGGGGWGYSEQYGGLRPEGGGGRGGTPTPSADQMGLDGVGGGSGNSYYVTSPNKGGDGIVIVRYAV